MGVYLLRGILNMCQNIRWCDMMWRFMYGLEVNLDMKVIDG